MADFSFLSDTDESAVDELISQAQDLCILEQVSTINCSSFVDSLLPSDLESRFRKLKTFPQTNSKLRGKTPLDSSVKGKEGDSDGASDEDSEIFSPTKQNADKKSDFKKKSQSGISSLPPDSKDFSVQKEVLKENSDGKRGSKSEAIHESVSSSTDSSISSLENAILSDSKRNPDKKKCSNRKSKTGSFSSPLGSSNSLMRSSPSPPKKAGCFWCSPKKNSSRKSKENRGSVLDFDCSIGDETFSDLGTFSRKEQEKILRKALKEEEKISREAEKIVKWAKQASARMNVSDIEDELSE
ncbi:hypothetical protein FEM48_Zijuj11G0160700 [Ziziphus jujuba var. spinosa]|uniref:Hepatoma-derived growth factor-related protein 2-like n=1 Tax=Ziziphus jujuba var. spinosa TaxID=714518 RepID=A0A978UJX3_ZIZJJ|nr:hypothetical protein FEM48_Zijuj11G0160700 [Ziziphus jujuba var. spinosa]